MDLTNQNSTSDLFPLILIKDLLKYCNDYGTLKTIQQSTTAFNELFTCPSQVIWKQLCSRNRYHYLLRKESKSLLKKSCLIWETIYYQNWKLDRNWINKRYEIIDLGGKLKLTKSLTRMINERTSVGLSLNFNESSLNVWDFKRGALLLTQTIRGSEVTSSCLLGNYLVLGKNCGSMIVMKMFTDENWMRSVKYHSKEISSIVIDLKNESIISGDVAGQVLKFNIFDGDNQPIVLYQNPSQFGITALILKNDHVLASTVDGFLIKISAKGIIKKFSFNDLGSINCLTESNESILMGTDSGKLIVFSMRFGYRLEDTSSTSPIISIAADMKKVVMGHFDGSITAFTIKLDGTLRMIFRELEIGNGAIWSVGLDEESLVSCSLNGEVILRRFS